MAASMSSQLKEKEKGGARRRGKDTAAARDDDERRGENATSTSNSRGANHANNKQNRLSHDASTLRQRLLAVEAVARRADARGGAVLDLHVGDP
jgi:hypothetical protein